METIDLDESFFKSQSFSGCEGNLYIYKDSLIKIFTNKDVIQNKIAKLTLLHDLDIDIIPTSFISINGEIKGYSMPYLKDYRAVNPEFLRKKKKLIILEKLNNKLDELHSKGIIYGDIRSGNILINSDLDLVLCDIDNVSINGYGFDILGDIAKRYVRKYGIDETLDIYSYNLYTAVLMYNTHDPFALDCMMYNSRRYKKYNHDYMDIIDNMVSLNDKSKIKRLI